MFKIKNIVVYFVLFCTINMSITGLTHQKPFYSLLSVSLPYNEEMKKYNFAFLLLNICVCLIFVSSIIQYIHQQYMMSDYTFTRTNKKRIFRIYSFYVTKNVGCILLIKIISDIVFSQMNGLINVKEAFFIEISSFLTVLIWILISYILTCFHLEIKWIYFILTVLILISQYISAYIPAFSLIVFGSSALMKYPITCLALKGTTTIILYVINIKLFEQHEKFSSINYNQ